MLENKSTPIPSDTNRNPNGRVIVPEESEAKISKEADELNWSDLGKCRVDNEEDGQLGV